MLALNDQQLRTVVVKLAQFLDVMQIDYAIMVSVQVCAGQPIQSYYFRLQTDFAREEFPCGRARSIQYPELATSSSIQYSDCQSTDHEYQQVPCQDIWPRMNLAGENHTQYECQGSVKEMMDIQNLMNMISFAVPGKPELNFSNDQKLKSALFNLLQKHPELALT
ncbi:hypothetical protein ACJ72_00918 [Emergomyces africanus]|uniref:Uncharacterized protein n=1 Tax=Emergomyces africanus TaxID=1955775 RepID=A0A1B7P6T7_9EURO|nr:hypothetical protein ACJ72_00918 [Emergomyces africanus]